jgi:hypothetical protein
MISLLAPTRNRVKEFKRMMESVYQTSTTPIEILTYVDEDDYSYNFGDSEFWPNRNSPIAASVMTGPRLVMSDYWNQLARRASGDILMLAADDIVFITPGWSEMIEEAFADCPDKILCVHGDDLGPNGKTFATLPLVSRRWVETVGYFTPPGFSGDFSDTWLNDVADMIGRKKFLPYTTDHRHHIYNKAEYDATYREKDERQKRDNLEQMYRERLPERIRDAEKLRAVINGD